MENEDFLSKIGESDYFRCLKSTFADLVPFLIGVSILYFIQMFVENNAIGFILSHIGFAYCVLISVNYSYHFAQLKNFKPQIYMFFSLLLSLTFMESDFMSNPIRLALPLFFINFLGVELVQRTSHFKFHFSKKIPVFFEEYLSQMIPVFVYLTYIVLMMNLQVFYIPLLVQIVDAIFCFLSSLIGILLVVYLICLIWRSGLHGDAVIGGILRPFWMTMMMDNLMHVLNHQPMAYIGTEAFYQWYVWIGGTGATLGFAFLCRYFAKSEHLKQIGKQAYIPGILNVNEEVIFGVPMVGSSLFKILFYFVPLMNAVLTYFLMYFGYIDKAFLIAPWVLPHVIGSYWVTGGQLEVVFYSLGLFVLSVLVSYPSFKAYDHSLLKEENHN